MRASHRHRTPAIGIVHQPNNPLAPEGGGLQALPFGADRHRLYTQRAQTTARADLQPTANEITHSCGGNPRRPIDLPSDRFHRRPAHTGSGQDQVVVVD